MQLSCLKMELDGMIHCTTQRHHGFTSAYLCAAAVTYRAAACSCEQCTIMRVCCRCLHAYPLGEDMAQIRWHKHIFVGCWVGLWLNTVPGCADTWLVYACCCLC
jgi:hypothetical protein